MRKPRLALLSVVAVAAVAASFGLPAVAGAAGGDAAFRAPIYVDNQLAGSEGFVMEAPAKTPSDDATAPRRLIYVTHEGTTLFYRTGASQSPTGDTDFTSTYRNQVNLWTSADDGKTWQRADFAKVGPAGSGFFTNPAENSGFSDPDVTTDGDGNVYITGIDLANDALVSSPDGGATWPTGTAQCREGDRPWLAGGPGHTVFLANDPEEGPWQVVRSSDAGASCSTTYLDRQPGNATGYGKIVYDETTDTLWDAAITGTTVGAISYAGANAAFDKAASSSPSTPTAIGTFTYHQITPAGQTTSFNTFWKAQIAESGDAPPAERTLYVVWSTAETPTNHVYLASSTDNGASWVTTTVASPTGTAYSPWVTAGTDGRVAVAWEEYANPVSSPSSAPADDKMYVKLAMISGGNTDHPSVDQVIDPMGAHGPVHTGPICTSGTTCVASPTGDRRLGEFFTMNPDQYGCVMLAVGDTMMKDPVTGGELPTARGLYTVQDSGSSLTGDNCAVAHPDLQANLPELADPALAAVAGLLIAGTVVVRRRRVTARNT
jgi:hypothetical protein